MSEPLPLDALYLFILRLFVEFYSREHALPPWTILRGSDLREQRVLPCFRQNVVCRDVSKYTSFIKIEIAED
jgi:hypothetical protein